MGRKNKKRDLPKYLYQRGNRIWTRIKSSDGRWVSAPTQYTVNPDQTELARKHVRALLRSIEGQRDRHLPGPDSVAAYAARWLADREERGVPAVVDDRIRLTKYVLPVLGDLEMVEVRPMHARDLVRHLRALKSDSGDTKGRRLLAPRTIRHIYMTAHNMFEDALIEEVILMNPIRVKAGELPKDVDADPEWRMLATFTVPEVVSLLSSPRLPPERRVMYALKALTGMRHGEAAALCWRHIDFTVTPLPRIHIVQSYCSRSGTVKGTKDEETRAVPVHPTLGLILAAWRARWESVYGRAPTPDDFVVPTRSFGCVHVKDAGAAMKVDLEDLGLRVDAGKFRDRGGHDLRAWYKTRCVEDGADVIVIRRTTHAPPKDVDGGYERFSWEVICRELSRLRIDLPSGDDGPLGSDEGGMRREAIARKRAETVARRAPGA